MGTVILTVLFGIFYLPVYVIWSLMGQYGGVKRGSRRRRRF